jgi:propanol-preferring alcohol dehydrogenase
VGNIDPAVAAMFSCSSITKMLPLAPDDPIVPVGAGGLGISVTAMLHALGHQAIIGVDISANKHDAVFKN